MNGRQEHNEIVENKTKAKIADKPTIVKDYYYSLMDKTPRTKNYYVDSVIEFLKYLDNNSFNIENPQEYLKIKASDIAKYMEEETRYSVKNGVKKENTEGSRATKYYAISNFFEFLISEGYIPKNPCKKVSPPKAILEKEVVALTPEEIALIRNNIITGVGTQKSKTEQQKWINRDLAILNLGCSTGLRVTAITEINLSDIDFENNTLTVVEKGNKYRTVLFGERTKETMLKWIEDRNRMFPDIDTEALFISRKKKRISARGINNIIQKFSVGINKHITPHKMRSSCATNLYEKTGDIYLVQEVLGHKNIANTRRYAKISSERRAKAVAILDKL